MTKKNNSAKRERESTRPHKNDERAVRALKRSAEVAESDAYAAEPEREKRLSAEELRGVSEYQYRAASGADEEDLDETRPLPGDSKGGPPRLDDLSVGPEELTERFLEGAVQDPRPRSPRPLSAEEAAAASPETEAERRRAPRKPRPKLEANFDVKNRSEVEREHSHFARDVMRARREAEK